MLVKIMVKERFWVGFTPLVIEMLSVEKFKCTTVYQWKSLNVQFLIGTNYKLFHEIDRFF